MSTFNKVSSLTLMRNLWAHISSQRKKQVFGLFFLMVFAAFLEALTVATVFPFLSILLGVAKNSNSLFIKASDYVYKLTGLNDFILFMSVFLVFVVVISGITRFLLLLVSTSLTYKIGSEFSLKIYRNTLRQPYATHINRNTSLVIDAIVNKTGAAIYCLLMALNLALAVIMFLAIVSILLMLNPKIAISMIFGFGSIYILVMYFTRKKLVENSESISFESENAIKSLTEGLGSIREIIISGGENFFCEKYKRNDQKLRKAQGSEQFIGQSPRFLIESCSILLLITAGYIFSRNGNNLAAAIPFIGTMVLGAQRLLPVMQQGYQSWSSITARRKSLAIVVDLMFENEHSKKSKTIVPKMTFNSSIQLVNLKFKYEANQKIILNSINLKINRGDKVGLIGKTGAGKSTLIDCILGLMTPTSGSILVDGVELNEANIASWQKNVSHVPQSIFFVDGSIAQNIALGTPKDQINHEKMIEVCKNANILDVILSLTDGFEAQIGQGGIKLSGGQRQRLGIARALYKNSEVLIFDEATSALDSQTEKELMECLENLSSSVTVIMIAHRLSTLSKCNKVVELRTGKIHEIRKENLKNDA